MREERNQGVRVEAKSKLSTESQILFKLLSLALPGP